MNFTPGEASLYLQRLSDKIHHGRDIEVILAPSSISLQSLSLQVNRRQFKLAAQNFYWRDFGAYTGEIAISQLRGIVDYAIIGHSERRHIFCETDKDIRAKVAAAVRNDITPILCIGETSSERDFGETSDVIRDQLIGGLSDITDSDIDKVIIAYEPVWAISSTKDAKLASPDDIADAVRQIRKQIERLYGKDTAESISVLYGGSVDADNVMAYLVVPGIDGTLVGSASLVTDKFTGIVEKANELEKNE